MQVMADEMVSEVIPEPVPELQEAPPTQGIPGVKEALLLLSDLKVFHRVEHAECIRRECRRGPIRKMLRIVSDYSLQIDSGQLTIESKAAYDQDWRDQLAKLAQCPHHARFEQFEQQRSSKQQPQTVEYD